MEIDDLLLDDGEALAAADPGGMLAVVAAAGASMRAAAAQVEDELLDRLASAGRPRAIVVSGAGGSGTAGEIMAAAAGLGSPLPIVSVAGPSLPGWIGSTDVVVCVSASGRTVESLEIAVEAQRRGCWLAVIAPAGSPLFEVAEAGRVPVAFRLLPPPAAGQWRARSLLWALATPLVLLGGAFGITPHAAEAIDAAADCLDEAARRCSPHVSSVGNPAKQLALEVAPSLPMVWGTGDVGAVAARRFCRQLAENAGIPAIAGSLPEAARTHAVLLAGPHAGEADGDDFYRDRVADPEPASRLRLVLLRDCDETRVTAELATTAQEVARRNSVPVSVVAAEQALPLVRLASLVSVTDFASVYAALAVGTDPLRGARDLDPRLGNRNEG